MVDKILEAMRRGIESGDPTIIKAIVYSAATNAERGYYCDCKNPKLVGEDLLCGSCYLINMGQVKQRPNYKSGWHTFWADKTFKNLCQICVRHKDHPLHYREGN